jgi:hypothetical protein
MQSFPQAFGRQRRPNDERRVNGRIKTPIYLHCIRSYQSWLAASLALLLLGFTPLWAAPVRVRSLLVGTGYQNEQATGVRTKFPSLIRKIYCVLTFPQREVGSRFKAVWVAVDAGGKKNYKLGEYTPPSRSGTTLETAFSLPRPFPTGKYRVEWFQDGKPLQSVAFTVQ